MAGRGEMPEGAIDQEWARELYGSVMLTPTRYRTHGLGGVTLTATVVDQAQALAAEGLHRAGVAQALGIPRNTFYRWVSLGREEGEALEAWIGDGANGEQPPVTLAHALCQAVEAGEGLCRHFISRRLMGSEDDRIVLAFAERRFPKQFSAKPGTVIDDETGTEESEADGVSVLDSLLGKLKALSGNMAIEPEEGGDGGGA